MNCFVVKSSVVTDFLETYHQVTLFKHIQNMRKAAYWTCSGDQYLRLLIVSLNRLKIKCFLMQPSVIIFSLSTLSILFLFYFKRGRSSKMNSTYGYLN